MLQVSLKHHIRLSALIALLVLSTVAAIAQTVPYKYEVIWDNFNGSIQTFQARRLDYNITVDTSGAGGGGGATGRPKFSPVQIIREFDGLSPLLARACATSSRVPRVILKSFRYDKKGVAILFQEITLGECFVSGFHQIGADPNVHTLGLNANFGSVYETNELESIEITYRRITIKNIPAGTEFSYDLATGS